MDEKILNKALDILVDEGLVGIPKLKFLGITSDNDCIFVLDLFVKNTNTTLPITTIENTWLSRYPSSNIDHGWGNGYVDLPEGHKFFDEHYDDINNEVYCPGGLTYSRLEDSGMWRVGFDTCHSWNKLSEHDEDYVLRETKLLLIKLYS